MKNKFIYIFIKIFYRKLKLSRYIIYELARLIRKIGKDKVISENKIKRTSNQPINDNFSSKSYLTFKNDNSQLTNNLIKACQTIYQDNIQNFDENYFIKNPKKRFLLTLESDETLINNEAIKDFISSDFVIDNISCYLKESFVLSTIRLWWTPMNNSNISSQLFHLDEEDLTQVKLFINISNVNNDCGPFTFLNAIDSAKILNDRKHEKRRYSDNEVLNVIDEGNLIKLTGDSGSGAFIDTSKCLHYGSRNNSQERIILMAQFLRTSAPLLKNSLAIS